MTSGDVHIQSKFSKTLNIANVDYNRTPVCHECGKKFLNSSYLQTHIEMHHKSSNITNIPLHSLSDARTSLNSQIKMCETKFAEESVQNVENDINIPFKFKTYRNRKRLTERPLGEPSITRVACELCGKTFKNESWLSLHAAKHHTDIVCTRCNTCFADERRLAYHTSSHSPSKPYSCALCLKLFSTRSCLINHMRSIHKEDKELYFCGECGEESIAFENLEKIRPHLSKHATMSNTLNEDVSKLTVGHDLQNEERETETTYYTVITGSNGEELVEIPSEAVEQYLSTDLTTDETPTDHEVIATSSAKLIKMNPDNNRISSVIDEYHCAGTEDILNHNNEFQSRLSRCNKVHQCTHCGIVMSRKYNLKRHMAIAHRLPTLECTSCGERFNSVSKLSMHKTTHVTDAEKSEGDTSVSPSTNALKPNAVRRTLTCQLCDRKVNLFSQLYMHTLQAHGQSQAEKLVSERFLCKICGKRLGTTAGFTYHMWMHTKMRLHRCEECSRRFMSRAALAKHMQTRHGTDRPHLCQRCGKAFSNKDHLKKHLVLTHGGRRDYLCGICGRTFLQSSHAKQHMWRHTGVKPMPCRFCSSAYTTSTALKKHILRNHPDEDRKRLLDEETRYQSLEGISFEAMVDSLISDKVKTDEEISAIVDNEETDTYTIVSCSDDAVTEKFEQDQTVDGFRFKTTGDHMS